MHLIQPKGLYRQYEGIRLGSPKSFWSQHQRVSQIQPKVNLANAEQRLHAHYRATRVLAESTSLEQAAPEILKVLCEILGWEMGILWLVDHSDKVLRFHQMWHAPALNASPFKEASRSNAVRFGFGLPGRVWASGEPLAVDMAEDPDLPCAPAAKIAGLRGASAFPIGFGNEVLGVLELFSRTARPVDPEIASLMGALGSQIGQFVRRTQVEQQLQESEERLRQIAEHQQAALNEAELQKRRLRSLFLQAPAMINIHLGPQHVYEFAHPLTTRLLGRDVTGLSVLQAMPELEGQGFIEKLDRVYATGEPYYGAEIPAHLKMPDGSTTNTFFNIAYQPLCGLDGRIEGVMTFAIDVTQQVLARKKIEEAREAAENLSHLKDEFLSTISHELRTPLTPMLGWTNILRSGNADTATVARGIEVIQRNVRAQAAIIEDLLDVSRVMTGKLRLEFKPVGLAQVVEAAMDAVRPAAESKGIRLKFIMESSAGPIHGDSNRLQQILWNLLNNAVKFTPRNGKVEVHLARVGSSVEIRVEDTGEGIDAAFIPQLFNRFSQEDSSTTRKHAGLGIGLSIVRHLVELHGGTVRAESPGKGRGATFIITLPVPVLVKVVHDALPTPPFGTVATKSSQVRLDGLKILVVDDEADARDLISFVLTKWGANVTTAESVQDALNKMKNFKADVIVSDIGMPGEDGYVLIRKLRDTGSTVPAIALTAFARIEDRDRALSEGFQIHVAKPVEPEFLASAVARVAGRAS